MSKIYEALLRAELDRGVADPGEAESAAQATSPASAPGSFSLLDEAGPDRTPAQPLTDVPRRTWAPQLDKLPGLQGRGQAAEQFRNLRSRLYEYRGFETLRAVLVSSGLPQEGKSFVAANLALSLARYKNSRVLLIDGDLRRSSLHQLLGTAQSPGLADYLAGRTGARDILQGAAKLTEGSDGLNQALGNLTFIAGGLGGDAVFDLAGNKMFEDLLTSLQPHFDWIIVDSSPVNLVADAVALAQRCDGVLLVARSGVTKYETLQRAQSEFKGSKLLGVVLNGAPQSHANEGYYGYNNDGSNDSEAQP